MIGFDGDPAREAALRHALGALAAAFPEHLAKPRSPEPFAGDELVRNEQFDAIVRAYKGARLALPIQALRAAGAPYHGFAQMRLRRFAWFVPALIASWLERSPGPGAEPFGAEDIEAMIDDTSFVEHDDAGWTDEEQAALVAFFEAALDAALATPLAPARAPARERPREDGVQVWSLHSPSVPLGVLRVARALRTPLEPLAERWARAPEPRAFDHLLEAVFDTELPSKRYLAYDAVAERLAAAFFDATGEHALRISKAEATVRRNIGRREAAELMEG